MGNINFNRLIDIPKQMKIIARTPRKLILANKTLAPLYQAIIFTCFLFVGLTFISFVERGTLKCSRFGDDRVSCEQKYQNLLGTKIVTIPAGELQRAELEESDDTSRVILITKTDKIPLVNYFSSSLSNKDSNVRKINNFLQNPNQLNLTVSQDDRIFVYSFFGPIAILIMLATISILTNGDFEVVCEFERNTKKLVIKRQKLFKTVLKKYWWHEIEGVKLNIEEGEDDTDYNLEIIMRSLKKELLYNTSRTKAKVSLEEIANVTDRFIKFSN